MVDGVLSLGPIEPVSVKYFTNRDVKALQRCKCKKTKKELLYMQMSFTAPCLWCIVSSTATLGEPGSVILNKCVH